MSTYEERAMLSVCASGQSLREEHGCRIEGDAVIWPDGDCYPRTIRGAVTVATGGERPAVCGMFLPPDAGTSCARCGHELPAHERARRDATVRIVLYGAIVVTLAAVVLGALLVAFGGHS